jgi:hypothetical protein
MRAFLDAAEHHSAIATSLLDGLKLAMTSEPEIGRGTIWSEL